LRSVDALGDTPGRSALGEVAAAYTRDLVYERLAPGVLAELEQRSPKDENGRRKNKLHQWLSDDYGHLSTAE
jgi:hypothetical protein